VEPSEVVDSAGRPSASLSHRVRGKSNQGCVKRVGLAPSTHYGNRVDITPEPIHSWRAGGIQQTPLPMAVDRGPRQGQNGPKRHRLGEGAWTCSQQVTAVGAVHLYNVRPTHAVHRYRSRRWISFGLPRSTYRDTFTRFSKAGHLTTSDRRPHRTNSRKSRGIRLRFFLGRSTERPRDRRSFFPTGPRFLAFLGTCGGCGTESSAVRLGLGGSQALLNSRPIAWGTLGTQSSRGSAAEVAHPVR